jgi:4-carboxymuconolactone decarboxylase
MKPLAALIASLSLIAMSAAQAETPSMSASNAAKTTPTRDDIRAVAPALDKYTQGPVLGDLWNRPGLPPRDRAIVTAATLIARGQTIEMAYYFNLALDNGVKPRELSEIITHLAFYSGWGECDGRHPRSEGHLRSAWHWRRPASGGFA